MTDPINLNNRTEQEQKSFAPHPPIPVYEREMKFYHSAQSFMQFINKDGAKIVFQNHFLATNNSAAQDYLDEEIQKHQNPQLSYADELEVAGWKMRVDPKGTVAEELKNDPDFMEDLRFEIENKVRRENGLSELTREGKTESIKDDSANKLAGVDGQNKSGPDTVIRTPTAKVTLDKVKDEPTEEEKLLALKGKQHEGAPKGPNPITPAGTDKLMPDAQGDSNSPGTIV